MEPVVQVRGDCSASLQMLPAIMRTVQQTSRLWCKVFVEQTSNESMMESERVMVRLVRGNILI